MNVIINYLKNKKKSKKKKVKWRKLKKNSLIYLKKFLVLVRIKPRNLL